MKGSKLLIDLILYRGVLCVELYKGERIESSFGARDSGRSDPDPNNLTFYNHGLYRILQHCKFEKKAPNATLNHKPNHICLDHIEIHFKPKQRSIQIARILGYRLEFESRDPNYNDVVNKQTYATMLYDLYIHFGVNIPVVVEDELAS